MTPETVIDILREALWLIVLLSAVIIGPGLVFAVAETELAERGVEKVAGPVAGEWAPGLVGTGHAGGEADNEQACIFVTE